MLNKYNSKGKLREKGEIGVILEPTTLKIDTSENRMVQQDSNFEDFEVRTIVYLECNTLCLIALWTESKELFSYKR